MRSEARGAWERPDDYPSSVPTPRTADTLTLHGHADLLEQFLALLLKQVDEIGQRLTLGDRLRQPREQSRKGVQRREAVERHWLQPWVPAASLRLLPECLRPAAQTEVILRSHQNEMVDDARFQFER